MIRKQWNLLATGGYSEIIVKVHFTIQSNLAIVNPAVVKTWLY